MMITKWVPTLKMHTQLFLYLHLKKIKCTCNKVRALMLEENTFRLSQ